MQCKDVKILYTELLKRKKLHDGHIKGISLKLNVLQGQLDKAKLMQINIVNKQRMDYNKKMKSPILSLEID